MSKGKKIIIDKPIKLTIYSNTCPDLTIIDLPGITRVCQEGTNIEKMTIDLVKKYCEDPSTIILCTIAANSDITTSDGLKLAMELDPKGDRTIGVLTKVDIMDRGTDCKKILLNEEIPLKRGYVAVKNRSQQDILDNITVQDALGKEKEYFRTNPLYRNMNQYEYFGTDVMIEKLKIMFFEHLQNFMPKIYEELKYKMRECEEELSKFGTDYINYQTDTSKAQYITTLLNIFIDNMERIFSGKMPTISENLTNFNLRLAYNEFLRDYKDNYEPGDKMDNKTIIRIIQLTEGDRLSGFPESEVINTLLEDDLENIRTRIKEFLDKIYDMTNTCIKEAIFKNFCRFPKLQEMIEELLNKFMEKVIF
jgi:hypothetical protein